MVAHALNCISILHLNIHVDVAPKEISFLHQTWCLESPQVILYFANIIVRRFAFANIITCYVKEITHFTYP